MAFSSNASCSPSGRVGRLSLICGNLILFFAGMFSCLDIKDKVYIFLYFAFQIAILFYKTTRLHPKRLHRILLPLKALKRMILLDWLS
jgi:hypothetical protein